MSEIVEGKPQLPPGICFVCEMSNPVRYIDTLRDFEGVVRERLDGRKYLCEECIEDAAKKLGFVTPKVADKLKQDLQFAKNEVSKLESRVSDLEPLEAALIKATTKPAPAKK